MEISAWAKARTGPSRETVPSGKVERNIRGIIGVAGIALALALSPGLCHAQIVNATLSGSVVDPTGAAIPEVTVKATDVLKGINTTTTTDSGGNYEFSNLPPGTYRLTFEMKGFKTTVLTGITLLVNQQVRIDAQLQVGALTTTVEVSGAAPLIEATTASVGTVIGQQEVMEFPLNLRRFSALATLVPGALPDNGGFASAGSTFSEQTYDANGNRDGSNNPVIDGMDSRGMWFGGFSLQPPPDAIQEFKIQTNVYSAAFGKSAGSTINLVTKAGTNQIHGGVYEFLRNDKLDARNFFASNQTNPVTGAEIPGTARPEYRRNQFGFNAGGPIRKNRTFVYGYYEGLRQVKGLTLGSQVPTDAEKHGDLSSFLTGQTVNLCGSGGPANLNFDSGQLFDPATESLFTCPSSGTNPPSTILVGTPIPGNVIQNIDPVAQKFLPYFPEPNSPGAPNFVNQTPAVRNDSQFGVRLDHTIDPSNQVFARYLFGQSYLHNPAGYTVFPGFGERSGFRGQNAIVSWTHTFGPHLLNEARVGFQRNYLTSNCEACPRPDGFAESFGIKNLKALPGSESFPYFRFSNFGGVGDATYVPLVYPDMVEKYQDNVTWTHGRHTVVAGTDLQWYQAFHVGAPAAQAGTFTFDGRYSSLAGETPDSSAISDFADGLLGHPSNSVLTDNYAWADYVGGSYLNYYVQDDFKVSSNLSLNLGFRWEYRGRPRDKQDRIALFVPLGPKFSGPGNATLVTALPAAQNDALCANNSWLLSSDGRCLIASSALRDKLGFGGGDRESLMYSYYRDFAPRLGIAWRPTHSNRLVIRTGYGIFYDSPILNGTLSAGGLDMAPNFITNALYNPSFGSPPPTVQGQLITTENVYFAAGIPPYINQPVASSPQSNFQSPRVQQWSFGIDTQLSQNWALEVDYVGNAARHLAFIHNYANQPEPGLGDLQARRPYPDYNVVGIATSDANSNYNSLQAKLTKRFSSGVSALVAYTFGKTLDDNEGNEGQYGGIGNSAPQDDNNVRSEYGRGYDDARQRLVTSYIWRLPVGKGNRYLNRGGVVDGFLGGWEFSGILSFQSGFPLSALSGLDYSNTGSDQPRPDRLCNGVGRKTVSSWFDTSCFTTSLLEAALASGTPRFGNSGRNILDGPGLANWDFGLYKNFRLSERFRLQFRSEFYNALNHPYFGYPNMTIGSGTVGMITSAGDPRDIQASLKLEF